MARALLDRLNPSLDPQERRHVWARLRTEITTGWQTEEHPRQRLTVADEREYAMFHFAEVLYRIVPGFYEEIAAALEALYGVSVSRHRSADGAAVRHLGGRRHGRHARMCMPRPSARRSRASSRSIVNEYFTECQQLSQLLSQSASRVAVSAELRRRIDEYAMLLPAARSRGRRRATTRCPTACSSRRWASGCDRPMTVGRAATNASSSSAPTCMLAARSLQANRGANAGYQLVRRLLLRVDTFGFHLATLDLKQRADVHHRVIGQGMDDPQWLQRSRRPSGSSAWPTCSRAMSGRWRRWMRWAGARWPCSRPPCSAAHASASVPSATTSWPATAGRGRHARAAGAGALGGCR